MILDERHTALCDLDCEIKAKRTCMLRVKWLRRTIAPSDLWELYQLWSAFERIKGGL